MKYQGKDLSKFSEQISFALNNYQSHNFTSADVNNIVVAGLGGSGIGGRLLKQLSTNKSPVPIEVISDYTIPQYINTNSLVILCSYSGNTEETLSVYDLVKLRTKKLICITTGGKLAEKAKLDELLVLPAISGFQPRMALGYPLVHLLLIFDDLFKTDFRSKLENALSSISNFEVHKQKAINLHKDILKQVDKTPERYTFIADGETSIIALRAAQQIQENAKIEAFTNELPEANHNVIESYYKKLPGLFVLIESKHNGRTKFRFQFLKELFKSLHINFLSYEIDTENLTSYLENIYFWDWYSLAVADHLNIVSSDIKNINALKEFLSKN